MKLQTVSVLLAGLLSPVVTATGCGGTVNKEVGMIVVYEVQADQAAPTDMQALTAVIDRRLNPGYRKSGRVRHLDDKRIEVSIFRAEAKEMQRIADLLPRPGTLEFRILANERDHPQLIARAKAEPETARLHGDGDELLAWWIPVQKGKDNDFNSSRDIATRNVAKGEREVTEVLVVKDPFDVNGSHLEWVKVDTDNNGRPCIAFSFASSGAQRLGGLTSNNLPDVAQDVHRRLGIIIDGELCSAPRIMSEVSKRGLITGDFTPQEAQDTVDLLNAGSLPVAIRKIEQRVVDTEKQGTGTPDD